MIDMHKTDSMETAVLIAEGLKQKYPNKEMAGNIVKVDGVYIVGVGKFGDGTEKQRTLSDYDLAIMRESFMAIMNGRANGHSRNSVKVNIDLDTAVFDKQTEAATDKLLAYKKLKEEVLVNKIVIGNDLADDNDHSRVVLYAIDGSKIVLRRG